MQETTILNLFRDQITQKIKKNSGFIPVKIDLDHNRLIWLDVGEYQFTEGFFDASIKKLTSDPAQSKILATDIGFLVSDDFLDGTLYPSGFIFHISRCGSTVLSKALARLPHHVVISESNPHNKIWQILKGRDLERREFTDENLTCYKNLVLAMGRQRTTSQHTYFVKFTSWNVLFLDFITAVFPDVPSIFIYRDPAEVMVSVLNADAGYLRGKNTTFGAFMTGHTVEETQSMSQVVYLEKVFIRFFSAALNRCCPNLHYLNYDDLNLQNFETILETFDCTVCPDQVALMREQFNFYSKDDSGLTPFIPDRAEKQKQITPEIRNCAEGELGELYQQLEQSESNLTR
jgi:hypothetical protein